jgi:hypothetical protein
MKPSNVKIGSKNSAFTHIKKKKDNETMLPNIANNFQPEPFVLLNHRKNAFALIKDLFHTGSKDSKICCVN